ncbi:hypothetical protein A671_03012 [Salmonella enterica subsp. enterica serovar Dublin str. DG22]|uniref:Uncharacterized protein n=1 Tax=Salmonella enterica subsp. enterica serovar Dublin str. UC16 TaxID=1192688 RepID=M7RI58_SALDU|nr:hypothetical protein A670_03453 [Salmonella enterica subsp. enterica serovar Dublin str. UC16]EPI68363.1 hypothetical protein A671_03012 [Salmonella enterica subsp. enterica serovar Dublin str. DG22]
MAASPVRPAKDESTGRPDKRSAIRLGNVKRFILCLSDSG